MIRAAKKEDIESVVNIHNQAIDAGFQTAFTERLTVEDRVAWFHQHLGNSYPMFVYEADGQVVGWFCINAYRQGRGALHSTVEASYFIHMDHQKKGIGTALMEYGLNACRQLGYKTVLAIILEKNIGTIRLLEKFGFERWGYLPGVAVFDGEECSHIYYGKKI
jgi:L-amino acid N-acyltransferase YncA